MTFRCRLTLALSARVLGSHGYFSVQKRPVRARVCMCVYVCVWSHVKDRCYRRSHTEKITNEKVQSDQVDPAIILCSLALMEITEIIPAHQIKPPTF